MTLEKNLSFPCWDWILLCNIAQSGSNLWAQWHLPASQAAVNITLLQWRVCPLARQWWHKSLVPGFGRQRQEELSVQGILVYTTSSRPAKAVKWNHVGVEEGRTRGWREGGREHVRQCESREGDNLLDLFGLVDLCTQSQDLKEAEDGIPSHRNPHRRLHCGGFPRQLFLQ